MNVFVEPQVIYIGLGVALGLILLFWHTQRVRLRRVNLLVSTKLLPTLVPSWSNALQWTKLSLLLTAVLLLFVALARPQWGTERKKTEPTGIDVMIALDVSKSMLARDVRPNRLERVKLGITNLLDRVSGDRLGLIAFSGTAFLQCPLTLDHQAFAKTLNDLEIGIIKIPGTNLASPIEEASRSFSKNDRDRFLILLSDGEDLEGEGLKRAKEAKEQGIRIYTIGIGSPEGARIPTDPLGQSARNFLKDPQGKTVVSQMDQRALQDISDATGGQYHAMGPTGEGLAEVLELLQSIGQKKKREQLSTELPIDRYQLFAIIGFLILISEMLTSSGRKKLTRTSVTCIAVFACMLAGCLKQDNVKRAEEAMTEGDPVAAAGFYTAEIDASDDKAIDPRLYLNAGLAHMEAGSLEKAEKNLEQALDASIDVPNLQSKVLNALGNVFYLRANDYLDQRDVGQARKTWEKALGYYRNASLLDGNKKADDNLASLKKQLEERIKSMICQMSGRMWRDLNGDGKAQGNEPALKGFVYWDKDGNGEHNSSDEPIVKTNETGAFAFEWISDHYPISIRLGSQLLESNRSEQKYLVPIYPPPPPPENPALVRNFHISIKKPGKLRVPIAYRAAPVLRGSVWSDENGNGAREKAESGSISSTLFLDRNGNFQLDENETTFKPEKDGSFERLVSPGQHSLCIKPDNPDANVTFPIGARKAYLTWLDFESMSENLDFGVQEPASENQNQQDGNPEQNQTQDTPSKPSQEKKPGEEGKTEEPFPQEVNALYERLLQEMESKSEPLGQEAKAVSSRANGRDY
ncbi:MAG: VWA domain-containing protein [Opitutae bacterium]|nr:VWA domain-containing protein [Opitutae bacterium]